VGKGIPVWINKTGEKLMAEDAEEAGRSKGRK
jgi:hypothetical protein